MKQRFLLSLFSHSYFSARAASFYFSVFAFFAPTVSGDQLFTNGLAIIDAPSAQSPGHAGAVLPIAVDVSGNGQLTADAANPNSTLVTHYSLLEVYLVSYLFNANYTVISGSNFLTGETGSVRHFNWLIPTCIPAGDYNLTFYETSQVNGKNHFIITPIPISVNNLVTSGNCTDVSHPLQQEPQAQSPLAVNPFITPSTSTSSAPTVVTITVSDGSFQFPTITKTVGVTQTMVIVTMDTFTTTVTGSQGAVTSVFTETFTTTAVMQGSATGFLPINHGVPMYNMRISLYWSLVTTFLILYY